MQQGRRLADRGAVATAALDGEKVPVSYRTLIAGGWVHYFNCQYGVRPTMASPLSFGTLNRRFIRLR